MGSAVGSTATRAARPKVGSGSGPVIWRGGSRPTTSVAGLRGWDDVVGWRGVWGGAMTQAGRLGNAQPGWLCHFIREDDGMPGERTAKMAVVLTFPCCSCCTKRQGGFNDFPVPNCIAARAVFFQEKRSKAGVAKLVDALDSKSCSQKECRFESDRRYFPESFSCLI